MPHGAHPAELARPAWNAVSGGVGGDAYASLVSDTLHERTNRGSHSSKRDLQVRAA